MLTLTLLTLRIAATALTLFGASASLAHQTQDTPREAAPATTPPAEITSADELLAALEHAGDDIRLLSGRIAYEKTFAIQGDRQLREGKLVFESQPGETGDTHARRFGIIFDKLQVGERVEDEEIDYLEQYIFDGEWIAEIHPLEKQFIRRQVVAPGERWDPLRVGEGPFPIPIQQNREDILRRFDAELVASTEALEQPKMQAAAQKCYQLKLTPRADAGEQDFREVRLWYDKETLLPRIARTVNRADDVALVLLRDLKLNEEAEVAHAELSTEPPADLHGWTYTQQEFEDGE
jgi:hypothetical protein